jgi:CRISPR-associated protein Cmr3
VGAAQRVALASPDRSSGAVGHRRLVWAAPAGSVYFLDFGDDAAGRSAAQAAARAWHGQPFPQADEAMRTAGFGLALTGRW